MTSGTGNPPNRAALLWCFGALISAGLLLVHPFRQGNLVLSGRSPFDNTGSGHAEQWLFLREAAGLIPEDASFTVIAGDREAEMSLSMMSVGLLEKARLLPSSYYGRPVPAGAAARFVLEYGSYQSCREGETFVTTLAGGTLRERRNRQP